MAAPTLDWTDLGEDVAGHTVMGVHAHQDGRTCVRHARLAAWAFGDAPLGRFKLAGPIDKRCLREHPGERW